MMLEPERVQPDELVYIGVGVWGKIKKKFFQQKKIKKNFSPTQKIKGFMPMLYRLDFL